MLILGFSSLIVLYNSTQGALNLLAFIEEVADFDYNLLYEISQPLH